MIRFAVLGHGFIGSVHAATLQKLSGAELVGIVEQDRADCGARAGIDSRHHIEARAGRDRDAHLRRERVLVVTQHAE